MKKLLAWVLCAALMLSMAAGCSGGTAETSGSSGGESSTASETPVSTKPDDESSEESPSSEETPSSSSTDGDSSENGFDAIPVDDAMQKQLEEETALFSGDTKVKGKHFLSDITDDYTAVQVEVSSGDYGGPDEICEAMVRYAENVCDRCKDSFPYERVYFALYVDDEMVAGFFAINTDGSFVVRTDPTILDNDYTGLNELVKNSTYFSHEDLANDLSSLAKYFDGDVTTAVEDDRAVVYIPIEEVTGENIFDAYHVFTDNEELMSLYGAIEVTRIYEDLDEYVFSVCTTDGEQVIDMILTCTDEMFEYDIDMDYNSKYLKEIADFSDLLSQWQASS